MNPGDDLALESLASILGDRSAQSHPVLLSTAVTAADWARAGAPHGAVVVADHQISPRGRAGRPWKVTPGRGLAFALVLRPEIESEREGWLYSVVLAALADVCGDATTIEWPDELHRAGAVAAMVGIDIRLRGPTLDWAAVNVLILDAEAPRGALLGSVLDAIDARLAAAPDAVVADYAQRCTTLGASLRVRLLGGTARLLGTAVDVVDDGSLLLEIEDGRRVRVRPQDISTIERH